MDGCTDRPTNGHILAQMSKPLLDLLVGYFSNILGYEKSILTFRHRKIYTGRCERSFGVLRMPTCHIGITIIFIIILLKKLLSHICNFMELRRFGQILWTKLGTEH